MKEQKQIKKSIIIYNIICYILLVCGSVYFQLLYKKRIAIFLAFIFASSYGMLILLIRLGKKHSKWIKYVLPGSCLLVSSVLSVIFVELISGNLFIATQYFWGNFLIFSALYFLLFLTTRRLMIVLR